MKKILFIFLCLTATSAFGQWSGVKPMLGVPIDPTHPSGDPVAAWFFLEGSGDTVQDLSGNGNIGTFQGTAPSWSSGKFGSAPKFAGAEYIEILYNGSLKFVDRFTIIAWVKPFSIASDTTIWHDQLKDTSYNQIRIVSEGRFYGRWRIAGATKYPQTAVGSVPANIWTHMALTYNDSELVFWVNGDKKTPISCTGNVNTATKNYLMGKMGSGSEPFNGLIDHVTIWNRALSAGEIAELYANPFAMLQKDNTALIASVTAPPAPGGQVIMIQMSMIPLFLIFTVVFFIRGKEK